MKKLIKVFFGLIFAAAYINITAQEVESYGKTSFNQIIFWRNRGVREPAFIKVGDKIIFQSQRDSTGCYENIYWAGGPYSDNPVQLKSMVEGYICLRWVIEVGSYGETKQYVIDFTDPKPYSVGPFFGVGPNDRVRFVYWGKNYALIKFDSTMSYKYIYKERKIVEKW